MRKLPSRTLRLSLALTFALMAIAPPAAASPVALWPSATVPITLHGDASAGWGSTNTSITNPGPQITVNLGDVIEFSLFSADGAAHILVIDLDRDGIRDAGEPASNQFSSETTATSFSYTASQAGTFQYFCLIHGATNQRGTLVVQGASTPPADNTLLIGGGVIVAVVIVAAAALMMRRRGPKSP